MEKITTYNYEAFYLDYLEGNLSDEGKNMLFEFLNQHPDLKAELEFDEDILEYKLPADFKTSLKQTEKESLKHCEENEICLENVDEFIIADIEHQISPDKKQELDSFVKLHQLEGRVNAYQSTKLKPNLAEVYPNKNELKHQTKVIPLLIRITAVAALFLLLFNVIDFNSSNQNKYQQRQAKYQYKKPNFDVDIINNTTQIKEQQQTEQIAETNRMVKESKHTKDNSKNNKTPDNSTTPNKNINEIDSQIAEQLSNKNQEDIDTTTIKNDNQKLVPVKDVNQEKEDNNVAVVTTKEETKPNIKLVDMYPPVTQAANNFTSLNVMAKKSTPESDYQVTQIKIGKFSFERKKKK